MSAVGLIPAAIDRRYNFVIQRLRLVTSTVTARTFHISAIATEEDADVHFVSLRFEPAKETSHSVPAIILVIVIGVFAPTFLTVNDEILIGLGQFLERPMHIDLLAGTGTQQILLGFAHFLPAKNAHHPLCNRERSEERRVGKECYQPCRSRWSPDHSKKKKTTQTKPTYPPTFLITNNSKLII